jgi:hypothetical protein
LVRPLEFPLRGWRNSQKLHAMAAGAATRFHYQRAQSFIAVCLAAAFVWTLALSVSPRLHARFHAESDQADHVCAATLISSGNYEHPVSAPLFGPVVASDLLAKIPALTPLWLESPFLEGSVLEHAPPFFSCRVG